MRDSEQETCEIRETVQNVYMRIALDAKHWVNMGAVSFYKVLSDPDVMALSEVYGWKPVAAAIIEAQNDYS